MLNFDEERYLGIQGGAVQLATGIRSALEKEFADGLENIFFAGAGGVNFLMQPAARLLQTKSTFPTYVEMAAELVNSGNQHLGPKSLVVFPTVSGTTKEALAALAYVRGKGARVLTLTAKADTPLAEQADINFTNFCADDTSSENFYLQSLLIALSIMSIHGEIDDFERIVSELAQLPAQLIEVKRTFEPRAESFANEVKDEQHHIMTGAGGVWFEAWYYGMCILEEMQWIWTRPVHASDFFHGTLELLEEDTSVWLIKGEDEQRPLADRVERFATTVTKKLRVFDSKEFALEGISDDVRALISPVVIAAAFERLSMHLQVVRDHPLTTRRYYKKGNF